MPAAAFIANSIWGLTSLNSYRRFRAALKSPGEVQRRILCQYVERNAGTAFGRAHGFSSIHDYGGFSRRVPIASYDSLKPWIERVQMGEPNVLTREPVTHLIPTSGTSGARKLIPFTNTVQSEFHRAIGPWMFDLFRQAPGIVFGRAYWSVTPVLHTPPAENSAIPIGFENDSAYLGGARRRLVEAVLAVPAQVTQAGSLEAFRYRTLFHLLRCGDLRLISVWHPSFLTLLLDSLPGYWEILLQDIAKGTCRAPCPDPRGRAEEARDVLKPQPARARELQNCSPNQPAAIWPGLRIISCWADAAATGPAAALEARFPEVRLQPKGLVASEALVTIPFRSRFPVAVLSHFFEFMDETGHPRLADELETGAEYEVLVTTGAGLWRYRLGDRVKVTGWIERTPSLRFLGRVGNVSDRCGEKLSEDFVIEVLHEVFGTRLPGFALLAPDESELGCWYTLYLETTPAGPVAERLDKSLRRNPHYAYCRDLGQLLEPRIFRVARNGYETFARHRAARGARLGEVKPAMLSRESGWSRVFEGEYAGGPCSAPDAPILLRGSQA